MAVDYSDVLSEQALDGAAQVACRLAAAQPAIPLQQHLEQAIRRTFCACVVEIEDAIEGGVSGVHAALLSEVRRRAEQALTQAPAG